MPQNIISRTFVATLPSSSDVKRFVSHFVHPIPSLYSLKPYYNSSSLSPLSLRKASGAVVAEGIRPDNSQNVAVLEVEEEEDEEKKLRRACEVYVCNFPRSFNAAHLLDMFRPYGTILSVEICRNAETDESKGCGYVTMGSIYSARIAVAELDRSDVGGREMRVRFSVEMNNKMKNTKKKWKYYEAPHKLYVGNLVKTVKPEELRNLFSRFGNVASSRVLQDRKQGKSRVYGFLSFESETQRDAALSLNGTEFNGRKLVVKVGEERKEGASNGASA